MQTKIILIGALVYLVSPFPLMLWCMILHRQKKELATKIEEATAIIAMLRAEAARAATRASESLAGYATHIRTVEGMYAQAKAEAASNQSDVTELHIRIRSVAGLLARLASGTSGHEILLDLESGGTVSIDGLGAVSIIADADLVVRQVGGYRVDTSTMRLHRDDLEAALKIQRRLHARDK